MVLKHVATTQQRLLSVSEGRTNLWSAWLHNCHQLTFRCCGLTFVILWRNFTILTCQRFYRFQFWGERGKVTTLTTFIAPVNAQNGDKFTAAAKSVSVVTVSAAAAKASVRIDTVGMRTAATVVRRAFVHIYARKQKRCQLSLASLPLCGSKGGNVSRVAHFR